MDKDRLVECKWGHQLTEGNIYIRPDLKRECLTCRHQRSSYRPHPRPPITHCHAGHELPPDRRCRPCGAAWTRRYRASRKAGLLGHRNLATTQLYKGKTPQAMQLAADRLDEAMG